MFHQTFSRTLGFHAFKLNMIKYSISNFCVLGASEENDFLSTDVLDSDKSNKLLRKGYKNWEERFVKETSEVSFYQNLC